MQKALFLIWMIFKDPYHVAHQLLIFIVDLFFIGYFAPEYRFEEKQVI